MRAIVEVILVANTVGGFGVWVARTFIKRKRESNIKHVRQLEQENRELDETIKRIKGGYR